MNGITSIQPRPRNIVAWDIEGSTSRTNPARAALRSDMYELVEAALLECEITEDLREPFYDRGDGAMTLLRPDDRVPKTLLLRTFVPILSELLAEHGEAHPERRFRLRFAIHAGEVHFDERGTFGEDIDITFRLLNAPELKLRLQETEAPLVLVVSDHIHRSVIRHGYDGIDEQTFERSIELEVSNQTCRGWVQVPAEAGAGPDLPRADVRPMPGARVARPQSWRRTTGPVAALRRRRPDLATGSG